MSACLTREFAAQLTATMDSVLRQALLEIMKIFESSLHDHQMELSHKGEEITQLKIKLQTTELKLSESKCRGDREADASKTQKNESQKEPEDAPKTSQQTSDVPEIDFEVPDDWCAPLGCETVTKQEDDVCPSVRLRSLYIPLWQVPVKQEVDNRSIDSHQRTKRGRKRRRGSSSKKTHKDIQDRSLSVRNQGPRRPPLRNDMKKLLQEMKHNNIKVDQTGGAAALKRGGRNSTGEETENTLESKREESEVAATESAEQEEAKAEGEKKYTCKFCKKVFETPFGRSVHVRSHKRCRGCKKDFPSPSSLRCHQPLCAKLKKKKWLAKEAKSTDPPKPESCDEEKPATPSKQHVILKKENTPSSSNHRESSTQKERPTKSHTCVQCNKRFCSRYRLKEHLRVHTGEKPFPCSMCQKTFRIAQSLRLHIMRMHKDRVNSSETNGDVGWTKPLEVIDDNQEVLKTQGTSPAINHNKAERERDLDSKPGEIWQTMGTQCSNGFICLLCQKLSSNKYLLIEHYRTHTGARPLKCNHCPARFRSRGQLSLHRKRCSKPMVQCEKCEKKFPTQTRYEKHMSKDHKDWPNVCKVCGKGFFNEGRLKNHMMSHK